LIPLNPARWSPDPLTEKLCSGAGNELWTVRPDGSGATKVLAKTSKEYYGSPIWSPDGKHLVHSLVRPKGSNASRYLARTPSTGGTPVVLTNDLNPAFPMFAHWWVSNTAPAP
jgi:hypothetical protein